MNSICTTKLLTKDFSLLQNWSTSSNQGICGLYYGTCYLQPRSGDSRRKIHKKLDRPGKEHGTLLIMDEANTRFFRTGKFFASEHFDIKPNVICMAKVLSADHSGIGAVITTPKLAGAVEGKIGLDRLTSAG